MIHIRPIYTMVALTLLLVTMPENATARNIKDFFKEIPTEQLPLLTENDRLDFIDYKENNMRARVTNIFGGKSEMTDLTDDYFRIELTKSSEMCAKMLLTESGDTVICVTHTFTSPMSDSNIHFYNTAWKELDNKELHSTPAYDNFWATTDTLTDVERMELMHKVDVYTTEIILSPETTDITYQLHVQVLEKKDEERITPLIKSQTLHWNGKCFSL